MVGVGVAVMGIIFPAHSVRIFVGAATSPSLFSVLPILSVWIVISGFIMMVAGGFGEGITSLVILPVNIALTAYFTAGPVTDVTVPIPWALPVGYGIGPLAVIGGSLLAFLFAALMVIARYGGGRKHMAEAG
ncbi:hypothetical protein CH339_09985 [Rhodobium orientis]|uniref:Uncharacterized protein n=1 Tax=Rhodobium orientis TaxID=34017 RepID=A0A327JPP9_9HYPH|nr:hypothetical protein [Rhodobium orientis]RAI27556.1 hypothetical protein CH339_09985 [Rhodobium orientis]